MKLRNKKTGEIVDKFPETMVINTGRQIYNYSSLAELNEEWEDYEEPKDHWYINYQGEVYVLYPKAVPEYSRNAKSIGNYFETEEEAEKAVEKLKAWKRLKDKGFKFCKDWEYRYDQPKIENHTYFEFVAICEDGIRFDDLDLLFGGEE